MLAERVKLLKPSPTLAITAKVRELEAKGEDVISFGAGEPDFRSPDIVCEAAERAIRDGFTHYTASTGIPELREAVCSKLKRDNGLDYSPGQVVVSCGAKHAVFNALMSLCNPGDEVILIAPFWMTYADQVLLAGGVPVIVEAKPETAYIPSREHLRAAVTSKTKAIIINSPCNPTGAVFPRETLKGIASLALRHNLAAPLLYTATALILLLGLVQAIVARDLLSVLWRRLRTRLAVATCLVMGVSWVANLLQRLSSSGGLPK